ncbi:MAG: hypothetical protein COA58_15140 [Bacteroidetes bacterium]|nr:MAG: hypothetical protein COA58_15140 [Bacteroidota bacterium]
MKLDWSKILIITMALFMIFIVSMGVKMISSSQELYEDNYYELGEEHASRMEKETEGEKVEATYNRSKNSIDITFDGKGYISNYKLVYLANSKFDIREKNFIDTPVQKQTLKIPSKLNEGIWILELSGVVNDRAFFKKQQFTK